MTLEGWSTKTGWTGGDPNKIKEKRQEELVEL